MPRQKAPPMVKAPLQPAFAHLNLRRNPFGEVDQSQRARLAVVEVDRFVRRLASPGYAVQFIGEQGRGKTTHLLAIARQLAGSVYIQVAEGERPRIPQSRRLLIDEAERLPRSQRCRVFRRPVSLALGIHQGLDRELAEAGFEVETVTLSGALVPETLHAMLNRRIEWARRGPGDLPRITLETAESLIGRFGDNVREIEWRLYELFQSLPEIRNV